MLCIDPVIRDSINVSAAAPDEELQNLIPFSRKNKHLSYSSGSGSLEPIPKTSIILSGVQPRVTSNQSAKKEEKARSSDWFSSFIFIFTQSPLLELKSSCAFSQPELFFDLDS